MRLRPLARLVVSLGLGIAASIVPWVSGYANPVIPSIGELLCPRNIMFRFPVICRYRLPRDYSSQTDRSPVFFYESPLPLEPKDPALSYFPFNYLRVGSKGVGIYESQETARRGGGAGSSTPQGFVYLSYRDGARYEDQHTVVYATERGYVRGDNVSRVSPSLFQGLAFKQTPVRPFGWVISGGSCPVRTPDGERDEDASCLTRYEIIQVYDQRKVGDTMWYLIGSNRWLSEESLSIVDPDPSRPDGVESDRWISVNLEQQNVAAYESGELVYATLSSTGRDGMWTQPGAFQVWARLERDDMSGGVDEGYYALDDVPWVLYFDQARALHGTYWHDRFGTPQSRGCVNLSIADARWFFNFAQEGSWVYVWDPSGETPTDPSLYTVGGA